MNDNRKRLLALLASLMLAAMLGMAACGGNGSASSASSAGASSSTSASSAENGAGVESESGVLFGSPWVTTTVQGNLPDEQPSAKDDLYTNVNYDYLVEHQKNPEDYLASTSVEVREATLAAIKDESRNDHEIQQMRILFEQASDLDALKQTGFSEVQPYIDMIDSVSSLDQMNALLASGDFPFSPFMQAGVSVYGTRGENVVSVLPNLLYSDALTMGGKYYQDPEGEFEGSVNEMMLSMTLSNSLMDSGLIGFDLNDRETASKLLNFEKSYAKYVDYNSKWLAVDYGAGARDYAESSFTMDELCAQCANFPLREVLGKLGKGASKSYIATSHEWLGAFNDAWTEDNLETIKLFAKCKVLAETAPFRDPSYKDDLMNSMTENLKADIADMNAEGSADGEGEWGDAVASDSAPADSGKASAADFDDLGLSDDELADMDEFQQADPEAFAFQACDTIDTFSQLIAKNYADNVLGKEAKDRLKTMTQELVSEYKDLLADTAWLGAESDEGVTAKLDNMALNVLEPDDGYFDYSGLNLVPTAEGGTLLSNYLALKQYRYDREAELIGQPATKSAIWYEISPATANAFYDPATNSINILPGFVTSSVYTADMSDTQLLAGAGFVVGHEISHGFDYSGSQFDAYAEPNPVYSGDDIQVFLAKCSQLADRYSAIQFSAHQNVDGQTVVGEAAADLCGLQASLALAESKGADHDEFFGDFAKLWAQVLSNLEMAAVSTDEHPGNNLRVNVNVQMLEPFYEAYGVAESDTMYLAPDERVVFWGEKA